MHFLYGFLACVPLYELARRYVRLNPAWGLLFAATGVMSESAVYEIIEWSLTLFVSPEQAEYYNGQQGDMWDAQKDMALALAGVAIFGIALAVSRCQPRLQMATGDLKRGGASISH